MFYTIYKTTNTINNKIYIGMHETTDPYDSYLGSGVGLSRAIRKYGRDNFRKDVLFIYDNRKDMVNKETELITTEFKDRRDTYNMCEGGVGFQSGHKSHAWGKRWNKTKEQILKNAGETHHSFKFSKEFMNSLYDPTKTINYNTTFDSKRNGGLYRALIKHVVDNNLPHVANQQCIKTYISRKREQEAIDNSI